MKWACEETVFAIVTVGAASVSVERKVCKSTGVESGKLFPISSLGTILFVVGAL